MTILVTGFTGNVGLAVGHAMMKRHIPFRAAVIDPAAASEKFGNAFHYRHLDYADISTFSQALKGVDQLFLMYPSQVSTRQFHLFLRYLRFTSVRHIVYLSFKDVPVFPLTPHHAIEKIIQETGIRFTIIRPGYYMQNLNLFMRDDIRFHEQIVTPAGLGKTSMIDIRDIATFVIHCLEHPAPHFNRVYTLHGEEVFGFHEIASLMTLLLGKTIRYTNPSIPFFQMKMVQKGYPKSYVNEVIILHLPISLGLTKRTNRQFREVTGTEPIPLSQYILDYQAHWEKH